MVRREFFAHVSPNGETLTERIKDDTRYLAEARGWQIGENLAWGTAHARHARPDRRRLDGTARPTARTS